MKEKINQKGFIQIPLLIGIIVSIIVTAGVGYGTYEYKKGSDVMEKAEQLIGENNYQDAINILSGVPKSNIFYYQKSQTKIEEAKRKMVEGQLSEEKVARGEAETKAQESETKAKQKEYEKKLKEQELVNKEAAEKMMNADNDGDGLTYRRELELGTSDWNTDSDNDGIRDKEDIHPAGGGGYDAQYFSWKYDYDKTSWEWKYSIHEDWYAYYKNKPRLPHGAVYVTHNDDAIKAIAKQLKDTAVSKNYHEVSFAIFFIQGLPYVEDYFTGYDDRPKYPVETLIDRNGDCEDLSYLAASIITAMDYDVVLVELPGNPGHMAIAIKAVPEQSGTYYNLDGDRYYYFETTAEGWKLGDIPDEFRYTPATLIKIPSGETINNINPQYVKPCYASPDFSGYYYDGANYYSDSQCNNITYCIYYKEFWYNLQTKSFYHDSGCSQIVVAGCYKSTSYPGYFTNYIDLYADSRCLIKSTLCRPSTVYSDKYYDGYDNYWDSSCTQKVVSWCSKSIYYPGYFFNSIDYKIYVDYQCTIKK